MVDSYFLLKMFVLFIYSIINIHGFHKERKLFSPKASVCRRGDFPAQLNRDSGKVWGEPGVSLPRPHTHCSTSP